MVNISRIYLFLVVMFGYVSAFAQETDITTTIKNKTFDPATLLWYHAPAKIWNDALPVGNGRLGAMVFGNPEEERIQFNEETYWSGGPYTSVVKGGAKMLPKVQQLVFEEKWEEAQKLFGRYQMGYPIEQQKYQPMGNVVLQFDKDSKFDNYRRWLDLKTGITGVEYTANGVKYKREVFSSIPDQAIVIRLTSDKQNKLSFRTVLRGVRNQDHSNYATDYFHMDAEGNNTLLLTGKSADYLGVKGQLKYEARLKVVTDGGTTTIDGDYLEVKNATSVTLYLVAATNFVNYKDVSADQHARAEKYQSEVQTKSFDQLKKDQIKEYQKYFNRLSLRLPVTEQSYLSTDERLQTNVAKPDPALSALAYQFGRFVLITSSLPGTLAANLQGIWNQDSDPMWDSKYTTNINLQMSYWLANAANLSDCAEPLYQLVQDVSEQGAAVAKEHYGAKGWVLHQNTDLWMVAAPMDGSTWGTFTTGGAWLCNQLWQQYLYTKDPAYLKKIYPLIKGSVEFFMDFLVKQPDSKWYVTNPSNSPENFPVRANSGRYFDEVTASFIPNGTNICAGSSIDMQIIHDLFTAYIDVASILSVDKNFSATVAEKKGLLLPPKIGSDGTLQEWAQDWGQKEEQHRHVSPLYGLYPGDMISYSSTPGLMEASKKLLVERGDENNEWSRAWKVCLWARMKDGDHAARVLKGYYKEESHQQLFSGRGNVMQIDGTMGVAAGIAEMIIQSHEGKIALLPAIPAEWKDGEVIGMCTRNAFVIDMTWLNGKVGKLQVRSKQGGLCKIQMNGTVKIYHQGKQVKTKTNKDGTIEFMTLKDQVYTSMI
ncbi:MAG: glycosyl hydrolase family 95 catalytic domain-containing protein [Sphingobacteriaceae bacterium]